VVHGTCEWDMVRGTMVAKLLVWGHKGSPRGWARGKGKQVGMSRLEECRKKDWTVAKGFVSGNLI